MCRHSDEYVVIELPDGTTVDGTAKAVCDPDGCDFSFWHLLPEDLQDYDDKGGEIVHLDYNTFALTFE